MCALPDQAQAGVRARLAQLEAQMNEEQGWVRGGTKTEVGAPLLSCWLVACSARSRCSAAGA